MSQTTQTQSLTLVQAVRDGLYGEMKRDEDVLVMGEDVGENGGVFRATQGLIEEFGEDRVIDTPLAESGIVGTAIGMAAYGLRPVAEIQFLGFMYPASTRSSLTPPGCAPEAERPTPHRWSSAHPTGAGSGHRNTTQSPRRRFLPTSPD
jgi:Pyruvate/2-oxoglutarate dehydrogenase complex, dehydrogenase (E1) component, eukaryotic type, beta subunit